LQAAQHDYDSDVAKLRQTEATNQKSQSDLVRYKQLLDEQELARSDYDQYLSSAKSSAASMDASAAAVASQAKLIEQHRAQLLEQQAKTKEALENAPRQILIKTADASMRKASLESYAAKLEQAKLNLTYCHVVAPVDGIVLQRSAEVGATVTSGQQLLMISQVEDPWVVANFKETQTRRMHPGQRVDVQVDALDKSFQGWVEAMPAATGDRASVLPSENATGNYVKVIQRLPVRIRFTSGQAQLDKLRPGMSVEPKVHLN
jgi:membrane fusion protein (multidrug efflux system)